MTPTSSASVAVQPSLPVSNRTVMLACSLTFLVLGGVGTLLGTNYQELTQRYNMPLEQAGIFTTLQFIMAVVGNLASGQLLDRLSVRYILAGGAVLMGVGMLGLAASPTLGFAIVSTIIFGLGFGALVASPNLIVAALNPDNPSVALNTLNVVFGFGAILGPQLVNLALQIGNFSLSFVVMAVCCFILAIYGWQISFRLPAHDEGNKINVKGNALWLAMIPFVILFFVYVGTEQGFAAWIFTQSTKVAKVDLATGTQAASLFWAGLTTGRFLASLILRRISDQAGLMLTVGLLIVSTLILLAFSSSGLVTLAMAFLAGVSCGPVFPTGLAFATRHYPLSRFMSSVLVAVGTSGATVIPYLQGRVGAGENGGMVVTLIGGAIMMAMLFIIQRQMAKTA